LNEQIQLSATAIFSSSARVLNKRHDQGLAEAGDLFLTL
jgi:hypothetical protein